MRIRFVPVVLLALACKKEVPAPVYQAIPVERRSITVSVRAAGTVQPDTLVEVKSKASGEILDIKVETGQQVRRGDLLVRVDQRTARNSVAQAEAQLEVARARLANAETQKKRSDELFKSQSITTQELETATLAVANAKAEVVNGQVAVENARIRMEDTDVNAPISGTIISKTVERGQVISSPTSDVGGGTVLLKMADLDLVQVRTLVDETDIGKIKPGLRSSVTVDAYPNQPFQGEVLKIEPQAETAQNVTMFPVLVRIENRNGLLKPGMNADVEIHVGERDSVLTVPNAALRTPRDINSARQVLGIDSARFGELMKLADARRDSIQKSRMATRPDSGRAQLANATGQVGRGVGKDSAAKGETMSLPDGRTVTLPPGITAAEVRALFQKRFSGGTLTPAEQSKMQQLMRAFGGGRGGAARRPGGGSDYQFGGSYIVIVQRHGEVIPVHIRTGLTDLDYSEVVWGIEPNDSVVILPSASLVQNQEEFRNRIKGFNQGVPGMRQDQAAPTTQARPQTPGRT
ncbi:MAG TPA: efflux RND transporter periplasmic adaptor subunit [Gemmatimonadales bacterium]|nr:efflux RND transporter periplasmic adaptor subunit [Gemmatimonadales bacterium]